MLWIILYLLLSAYLLLHRYELSVFQGHAELFVIVGNYQRFGCRHKDTVTETDAEHCAIAADATRLVTSLSMIYIGDNCH